jgi:hypothetical protein
MAERLVWKKASTGWRDFVIARALPKWPLSCYFAILLLLILLPQLSFTVKLTLIITGVGCSRSNFRMPVKKCNVGHDYFSLNHYESRATY